MQLLHCHPSISWFLCLVTHKDTNKIMCMCRRREDPTVSSSCLWRRQTSGVGRCVCWETWQQTGQTLPRKEQTASRIIGRRWSWPQKHTRTHFVGITLWDRKLWFTWSLWICHHLFWFTTSMQTVLILLILKRSYLSYLCYLCSSSSIINLLYHHYE